MCVLAPVSGMPHSLLLSLWAPHIDQGGILATKLLPVHLPSDSKLILFWYRSHSCAISPVAWVR